MKDNIGQYQVKRILGRGGMGAVYLATDSLLHREVAIKTVQSHMDTSTDRFFQEARTLAKLNHPNIASLYNLIQEDGNTYMVMEYINGISLEDLIKAKGQLSVHQSKTIFTQIIQGLSHAHEQGIVHRDIKSSNVMINERGITKLMDFGIAVSSGNERYTKTGNILGTLEYISPEIIKGEQPSVQSDIYALGILLYEMVSGRTPFQGTNEYAMINAHINQKPPELSHEIPSSLKKVIKKCLAKSIEKRYKNLNEVLSALKEVQDEDAQPAVFLKSKQLLQNTSTRSITSTIKTYKTQLITITSLAVIIVSMALLIPKGNSGGSDKKGESESKELSNSIPSSRDVKPVEIARKDPKELKINKLIYEGSRYAKSKQYLDGNRNLFKICQEIIQLDDRNSQAQSWLQEMINHFMRNGINALNKGNLSEARQLFKNVLTIDPNHQDAKNNLFKVEQREKELKKSSNRTVTTKKVKPLADKQNKPKPKNIITPIKEDNNSITKEKIKTPVNQEPIKSETNNSRSSESVNEEINAIEKKKSRRVTVVVPKNKDILLSVTETLSSFQNHSKGKSISLQVLKDVYINGILVIKRGAKGRATLENFKSSKNNQKGLIELKVKQVQAVDGSWLEVKRGNFKIPGNKGEEIKFTSSTQLQVKTSKSININAYQ